MSGRRCIKLPDQQELQLVELSDRTGRTVSEIIREAIDRYLEWRQTRDSGGETQEQMRIRLLVEKYKDELAELE